jgi:hypothetical protein
MALASTTVWEVDSVSGNDSNGGGFDSAATGTDKSRSAPAIRTDLVLASTTTLTSAGTPFTSTDVGNIIQILSGTGFTVGFYKINSVAGSTATLDRVAGTSGSTGGTGRLGGPLATIGKMGTAWIGSNIVWIKDNGSTYALAVGANNPAGNNAAPTMMIGYGTTRGDSGRATILGTTGNNYVINQGNAHQRFKNLIVSANIAGTATSGINVSTGNVVFEDCDVISAGNLNASPGAVGFDASTHATFLRCLVKSPRTSFIDSDFRVTSGSCLYIGCISEGPGNASANTYPGFHGNSTQPSTYIACISRKHGGANGRGFYWPNSSSGHRMMHCIADDNKSDGLLINVAGAANYALVMNNIFSRNQGNGFKYNATALTNQPIYANAYYSNTLGNRNNIPSGSYNIDLTASPFVDADNGDFRLNGNNPGGAQLKGAGYLAILQYVLSVTYFDIGLQHQDSGGGGASAILRRIMRRAGA